MEYRDFFVFAPERQLAATKTASGTLYNIYLNLIYGPQHRTRPIISRPAGMTAT